MKYLYREANGEHLYIESDALGYYLVSTANHSDKDGLAIRNIRLSFDDGELLKSLALFPVYSQRTITAKGKVEYYEEITQTGSAWDAEEAVVGIHDEWTATGIFSVNILIGSQNQLVSFSFNEGKPFTTPYRNPNWRDLDDKSRLLPSELNVTRIINPWGYMIYNSGDVTIKDGVAHLIASSDEEPVYFTPEKNIPVYTYICGQSGVNQSVPGNSSVEMSVADFERQAKNITRCPICFPEK